MRWVEWAPLALVCLLGAMSPGPSLAVVIRNSLGGGVGSGIFCAFSHGLGIFVWAGLMVGGVGFLILQQPVWFEMIRLLGAVFLLYMGIRVGMSLSKGVTAERPEEQIGKIQAAVEGFVIALSNPKIAIFFAALFSQFIKPEADLTEKVILAGTAAGIDALWYSVVALMVSRPMILERIRGKGVLLNRTFGLILVVLAISVLLSR